MPHQPKPRWKVVPRLATSEIIEEAKKGARSPYEKLARRGVPLGALTVFIQQVIFRQAASHRRDWDQLKKIEPHTLRRFPKRIRRLADQIEFMNSDPKLDPIGLLLPERKRVRRNLVQEIREGAVGCSSRTRK